MANSWDQSQKNKGIGSTKEYSGPNVSDCAVHVVAIDGSQASNCVVVILESPVPMPEIGHFTDSDGKLDLALQPGRYRLAAHGRNGEVGEATVKIPFSGEIIIKLDQG